MKDAADVVTWTMMITTTMMTTMTKSTSVVDVAVEKMTMMTTRIDPVDVEGKMTMKRWISPAPRTGDVIVTMMMTNPLCVVVEEDGECDGTGSLLFQ